MLLQPIYAVEGGVFVALGERRIVENGFDEVIHLARIVANSFIGERCSRREREFPEYVEEASWCRRTIAVAFADERET